MPDLHWPGVAVCGLALTAMAALSIFGHFPLAVAAGAVGITLQAAMKSVFPDGK